MTAVARPTIKFVKVAARGTTRFVCTCGASVAHRDVQRVEALAQAHSDWHWERGEHSMIELGGLL